MQNVARRPEYRPEPSMILKFQKKKTIFNEYPVDAKKKIETMAGEEKK